MPTEFLAAHMLIGVKEQPGKVLIGDRGRIAGLLWPHQDFAARAQPARHSLVDAKNDVSERSGVHVAWGGS